MFELNTYLMHLIVPAGIVAAAAIVWVIGALVLRYWLNRNRRKAAEERIDRDYLVQVKVVGDYLTYCRVSLLILPAVICGAYSALRYLGVAQGAGAEIIGLVLFTLMVMLLIGVKLLRFIGARNRMRLAHESRLATRRVLDPLLKESHCVFHDVIGDQFSIDHLVVGPKGVFAIQTHAEPTASSNQRLNDPIVTYNGRELFFPKGSDHGVLERARCNAEKLSQWLSGPTDERVAVRAIVALPGWTVRRTSAEGIPIINPKQFASLFEYIQPWKLPATTIQRIERQLQQISIDSKSASAFLR
jgi:hypothetical protein